MIKILKLNINPLLNLLTTHKTINANNGVSNYMRQNLIQLQGETDESIIIAGHLNASISEKDRYSRQK